MGRAGLMDRRITIQQKTTTQDDFGDPVKTWADVVTVWASKREISGREIFEGGTQAIADTVFVIRWRSGVTNDMRITYDGNVYDIVNVKELGRRERLEITTQSLVA